MKKLASVLILTLGAICISCDGSVRATGRVRDPDKKTLSNANITLQRYESDERKFTSKSDAEGCFSVGGMTAPGKYKYNLIVSLAGYKTLSTEVETLEKNSLEVTLMPESSEASSNTSLMNTGECKR